MRRAPIVVLLAVLVLVFCAIRPGSAATTVNRINGVGLIDYSARPTFKVGDFVRYAVETTDLSGTVTDSYTLTVLIAGQEIWWGERCFDVETWTDGKTRPRGMTCTLMSYDIFEDSLAADHRELYMRKTILGFDPDGGLQEVVVLPKATALTSRGTLQKPHEFTVDTLAADTVSTPMGVVQATKYVIHEGWGNTGGSGDSTVYKELRQDRTRWMSNAIPVTHCAREQMEIMETSRAWMIGRSREGTPAVPLSGGTVSARVIEYGHGLTPRMLPAERRKSFDQLAAPKTPARAAAAARPRRAATPAAGR